MESSRTFAHFCAKSSKTISKRIFSKVFLTLFTIFGFTAPPMDMAHAANIYLSWNASSSSSVAGYKICYGTTSGNYSQVVDVGNDTSYTISNLADGKTYYFASVAYDSAGNQSGLSNEVSENIPAATATYTITATAGSGGSVTAVNNTKVGTAASGSDTITSVTVTSGSSQSFSITPNRGYSIADVKVNGTSVGKVSSYTFNNVTTNHTIAATFSAKTSSAKKKGSVN